MVEEKKLEETIKNLSDKKEQHLTEKAKLAKKNYDDIKDTLGEGTTEKKLAKNLSSIEMFNENVKILISVFYKSKFDEFIYLLANPQKLFTMNFFIGIFRGMGFFIGGLFILFLFYYFFKDLLPLGFLK